MRDGIIFEEGYVIHAEADIVWFHYTEADDGVGHNLVIIKILSEEGEAPSYFEFFFACSFEDGGGEWRHYCSWWEINGVKNIEVDGVIA